MAPNWGSKEKKWSVASLRALLHLLQSCLFTNFHSSSHWVQSTQKSIAYTLCKAALSETPSCMNEISWPKTCHVYPLWFVVHRGLKPCSVLHFAYLANLVYSKIHLTGPSPSLCAVLQLCHRSPSLQCRLTHTNMLANIVAIEVRWQFQNLLIFHIQVLINQFCVTKKSTLFLLECFWRNRCGSPSCHKKLYQWGWAPLGSL